MKMSDRSILLPPVTKHRLKLTVKLMCHRHLCLPSALPPPAPLVDAGPNPRERKEINIWFQEIHQQSGHRDNRTLVRLLKQRGTHPWV